MVSAGASASWRKKIFARDLLDRGGVVAAGEDVEAVEADPDGGVVGELHDPPGAAVVVDEPAPGQRLVGEPDAVRRGLLAQPAQLGRGDLVVVDRGRGDVAADQHRVDAEPLHEPELRPRPAQDSGELLLGDALGVAERLVEVQGQPEPRGQGDDLLRAGRRRDQVGLEDLDAVETRLRAGVQLLGQGAAQADGGDRGAHRCTPTGRARSEQASRVDDQHLVDLLRGGAAGEQPRHDPPRGGSPCASAARARRATTAASPG